jgi:type III pantothenate kinase
MLLAIDIGNSSIKFGIFDGDSLIHKFNIATNPAYTAEELIFDRFYVLDEEFIQLKFSSVVIVSVVPKLNDIFAEVCAELFKLRPLIISSNTEIDLKSMYDRPEDWGVDRRVNSYAARELYGPPLMVCSFGTATTIDVVDSAGVHIGGIITAGIGTTAAALHAKTANLPSVRIHRPERAIQAGTEEAIMSGVYYGHAALATGLISRLTDEYIAANPDSPRPKIIATGGFAGLLQRDIDTIDLLDENLTLHGLRLIAERLGDI